ncbi:TPA: hypothetical protein QHO27_004408 [Klebsiella pneumoniae subsp. pneumoniae]|uniref:hypothetical protein n=1 Tax=Phytobacter diazotrophicus TaxID=395631 RepID=UPI000CD21081|nr:hypothetical protein [Phytobacter diazotrophicus]AUV04979.1 hypothetical protein C2U52_01120 [Enterobacteriaceae bacterium ENNIH2]RDT52175.1 hypothetical protein DXF93_22835 [Escherichia coli]HAU8265930.1 hypothetical protein [Kluyvera intermedia]HDT2444683.1 hypothetical protein [Klebsiella pneumoniae subsp. pneumoniae]MDV2903577.1 hypothetical protein [Phytobacter diazotrophicus]
MTEAKSKKPYTRQEKLAVFLAAVWALATGWLFLFSAVAEPPLPPPAVALFLVKARTLSLPGWSLALLPLWCLWMDYQAYGELPTLKGWLGRYGLIVAASLGTAFWIFSQRDCPDVVAQGDPFFYILLWAIFGMLCTCRRPAE